MARIRYIKPEFFEDTTLAELSMEARLLYVGLWCFMDRNGVLEDNPKLIKRNVFPFDDAIGPDKVDLIVGELVKSGRLVEFTHQGKRYLICPTFRKHQKLHPAEKHKYAEVLQEFLATPQQPTSNLQNTSQQPTSNLPSSAGIGIGIGIGTGIGTGNGDGELGTRNTSEQLREQSQKCFKTWQGVLDAVGYDRKISAPEQTMIVRAIQNHGYEAVDLALYGALFEPKFEGYNPREHLALDRIFVPDQKTGKLRFPKFLNWGAAARKREREEAEHKRMEAESTEVEHADPEVARKALEAVGFKRRGA